MERFKDAWQGCEQGMKESQGRTESIISGKMHNLKWCISCDRKWKHIGIATKRRQQIF